MKVEQTNPEPQFRPVVITLETQEEIDAFTTILNHSIITDVFPCLKGCYETFTGIGDYSKKWWQLVDVMK